MNCRVIKQDLHQMHAGRQYKGYWCVLRATQLCMQNEEHLFGVTKSLYPQVAKALKMNRRSVEHNIRYLIAKCWKSDAAYLQNIAGYPLDRPPTNREFLEILLHRAQEMERRRIHDTTRISWERTTAVPHLRQ